MKGLFAKLKSRKFLLTVGSIAYGAYLVRTGNVTEGVTIITGGLGTYNIGQGMADAKAPSNP